MEAFLSSTFGVFIAEIGDKTQLLTLFLAARFAQKNAVIAGIFAATLLNHLVSAWLGVWLAASVSPVLVKWIVGLSFIAGLMLANVPVAYLGEKIMAKVPAAAVRRAACLLFCLLGVLTLAGGGIGLS